MRRRALVSLLIVFCLTFARSAFAADGVPVVLDESQGHVIPIVYDRAVTPMPLVDASVDGKSPLRFLLDTGTSVDLTIEPWAAEQWGLKPDPSAPGGGDIAFQRVAIDGVTLAGAGGKDLLRFDLTQAYVAHIGVLDTVFGTKGVAGIIGLHLLSTVTSRLDFANKTLTIFEDNPPLNIPGAVMLPMTPTPDGRATVSIPLAPGHDVALPVDTGSVSTAIPLSAVSALKPKAETSGNMSQQIDAVYICPDFLLPELRVGGLSIPDVVVSTLPDTAHCALGLNVLTLFRVTFDMPRAQLILEPLSTPLHGPAGEGWTGIGLRPNGTIVRDLDPQSPARKAGLRVGDEIVSVDGYQLSDLPQQMVFRALDGDAGSGANLNVRRGDATPIAITFTRAAEFAGPKHPFDGLIMKKPNGKAITVIGVQKGCAADKAGMRAGDAIVAIDGEPTSIMTIDQMTGAFQAKNTHLEVTRVGAPKRLQIDLKAPDV